MASQVEEFIARLNDQVSPGAKAATTSLSQLEAQMLSQQQAAMKMQQALGAAFDKQIAIGRGDDKGRVNVAQYRKAQAAVAGLTDQLGTAQANMEKLASARGLAAQVTQMEQAEAAITSVADAMKELEAQQQLLRAGGKGNSQEFANLGKQLTDQRGKLVQAQQAYVKLGGSARTATAAAGGVAQPMEAASEATGKMASMSRALGAAGPAGILLAVAAAAGAAAMAIARAVISATKFAIAQADMARNNALSNQALEKSFRHLKGVGDMVERVSGRMGIAQSEVRGITAGFARTRLSARALENAMQKVATAKIAGASEFFLSQLRGSLMATGKVAPHLAAQMSHFEQIAAAKMLSLDNQAKRMKLNFGRLFSDLKIEPLLKNLSKILLLFDKNTETGKQLKFLLEAMFQPLIDGAARVLPLVRTGMLLLVNAALRAYIAFKRFMLSSEGALLLEFIGQVERGLVRLRPVAEVIGGVIKEMFVVVGLAIAIVIGLIGASIAVWGILSEAAASAWQSIISNGQAAIAWIQGVDLAALGTAMMEGLANGITAAGASVAKAVKGVVNGAIESAKSTLQIKSPSRVFFNQGVNTARGMELGVMSRASAVEKAVVAATAPTAVANDVAPASPAGGTASRATSDGDGGIHFHNCSFVGVSKESIREWMREALHEDALAEAS